ncbi:uncharacterized protein LOC124268964 [Haliotis rubra]|uniref:uncharacterized protein LOC124268964 n=1 Tax=Haliotis rubra TaxID=36100 RepID=UPI001EE51303|nr:uncharacterized protein LOC124268964 [Haliotis rubra]
MSGSESTFIPNHTTPLETPPSRRRSPRCLFYVVFAFSVSVNVALAVLFSVHMQNPGSFHQKKSDVSSGQLDHGGHDMCFTCDQFGPMVESLDTNIIRTSSHQLCCQRSNTEVREAFKKMIIDELNRRIAGSDQLNSPAMLNVFYETINIGSTGAHLDMVPIKGSKPAWTIYDDYSMSYCANVVCDNGTIRVPGAGRYLVYSHITLNVTRDTIFTHRIHRNGENTVPLLISKVSITGTDSPRRTSFLSAVLKLKEHDVISVYILDEYYDLVEKSRFSNYLGLFRL